MRYANWLLGDRLYKHLKSLISTDRLYTMHMLVLTLNIILTNREDPGEQNIGQTSLLAIF